jgi:hypothetical protein
MVTMIHQTGHITMPTGIKICALGGASAIENPPAPIRAAKRRAASSCACGTVPIQHRRKGFKVSARKELGLRILADSESPVAIQLYWQPIIQATRLASTDWLIRGLFSGPQGKASYTLAH